MQLAARPLLCIAVAIAALAGCAAPATRACRRYDVASLVPENGFAAAVPWDGPLLFDAPAERIDVALLLVRPVRDPIELVHVVGDRELERWTLFLPDPNRMTGVCWIAPWGGGSNCAAVIAQAPQVPGGYYYLRPNGNAVLEAGLAFYLCD